MEYATHVPTLWFGKTSDTDPPDTDENAEPKKPDMKRKTSATVMFGAKATPKLQAGHQLFFP
jgi:hypothetical protein